VVPRVRDRLRARYGPHPTVVLIYPYLHNTTDLADAVQQVARTRVSHGDRNIKVLYYGDNALGLDHLGCDWHPSLHDDRLLAGALTSFISSLAPAW